jgi:flagellar protein FliL
MTESRNKASTTAFPTAQENAPILVVQRKSSLPLVALVIVLAVGVSGGTAWYFQQHSQPGEVHAGTSATVPVAAVVHLEGFTVNLADKEDNHFLRVTMDLSLDRLPATADKEKPAASLPMARIRDVVLSVLTACNAETLLTPEGKMQLKKRLLDALNSNDPELGVRDIYFTEFLVQR